MASHGQPQSILDPRVFLGCKLSVISNADIRYEGTLFSYNEIESTLALQYVHSFGTEDRRVEKIPPSSEMFEIIIFRVADIKDLEVCDAPAKVAEIRNTVDPAIVRTEKSGATTVKTPVLASSASAKPLNLKIHPGAIMAFFLQQQLNAANSGTGNSNRQGNTRRRGRARAASQGTGGAGINRGQQSGATANGGGGRNNLNGGGGSGNGGPGGNGMRSGGPLNSGNMRNNAAQNNLHLRLSKEYQNVVYEPTAAASVAEPLGPNSTGAQDQDLMEFSLAAVSFDMFDKIYAQKVRELYGSGPGKEDGLDENKDPKQYYDPQGFFDKISSDAMADDTISRLAVRSRKEEREMNAQTFGVATSFGGQQNGGGQNGSQGGSGGQNQGGMGRRGNNNRGRGGNMGNNSGGGGQNGGGGNRTGNGNNNGGGNRSGGGGNGQMRGRQGGNQFGGRSQQRGGYGGRGFRGGRFGRNNMNNNNNNRGNRSMGGSFNGGAGNGIPDGLKDLLQRYLPNLPMDALFELQAQQSQQNNNNSDGASGHVDWTFPIGPEVDYDVVQGGGSRGMEVSVQ